MKNSKIALVFVGLSVLLWMTLSLAIYLLPMFGLGRFLEWVFKAHPAIIMLAVFPVISMYVKATNDPMPKMRAVQIAVIALVPLLPLTILADSLNAHALLAAIGLPELEFENGRNYIIVTYRGLAITTFATLIALGFVFPAQVKLRQEKQTKT